MVVASYLPPLPVGQLEGENGGHPRRKAVGKAPNPGQPTGLTWSSIARMVNKKESRLRRKNLCAKSSSMPALVHQRQRSRSTSQGTLPEELSTSTPALPPLVEAAAATSPALGPRRKPSLVAEILAEWGREEHLSEMLPENGSTSGELQEEQDAEDQPLLMVAPWKKIAGSRRKKLVRQCAMTFRSLDSMELEMQDETEDTANFLTGLAMHEPPSRNPSRSSSDSDLHGEAHRGQRHWNQLKVVRQVAHNLKPSEACDSGSMLDTMQQWRKYCRKTDHLSASGVPGRAAGGTEALAKSIRDLETELQLDRDRLRLMIQQGVHKTKNGLKLTVRHVQPDIGREALWRQRRETLEKVDTKGKRIQQALNDAARSRKDLQTCVEALRDTMNGNVEVGRKKIQRKDATRMDWADRMDAIRRKLEEFILTGHVDE